MARLQQLIDQYCKCRDRSELGRLWRLIVIEREISKLSAAVAELENLMLEKAE